MTEAGAAEDLDGGLVEAKAGGAEMQSDKDNVGSPETYLNYSRGERFSSTSEAHDEAHDFAAPETLDLNHWALAGNWTIGEEHSALNAPGGRITYRFHARDLHLVLGSGPTASRFASASRWTARRPAPTPAWTPTPTATGR